MLQLDTYFRMLKYGFKLRALCSAQPAYFMQKFSCTLFLFYIYSTKKMFYIVSRYCALYDVCSVYCTSERIKRFIEAQAFLRSYGLAPRPPPPPSANCLFFIILPVCRRSSLLTGERVVGGGHEAESQDCKKAGASTYRSILSDCT